MSHIIATVTPLRALCFKPKPAHALSLNGHYNNRRACGAERVNTHFGKTQKANTTGYLPYVYVGAQCVEKTHECCYHNQWCPLPRPDEGDRQGRLARPQRSTRCGGLRPREPREGFHTFTSTSDDTIGSGRTR